MESEIVHPAASIVDPTLAFGVLQNGLTVRGLLITKRKTVRSVGINVQLKRNAVVGKSLGIDQGVLHGYRTVLSRVPDKCGCCVGGDVSFHGVISALLIRCVFRAAKQVEGAGVSVFFADQYGVAKHSAGGLVQIVIHAANSFAHLGKLVHGAAGGRKVTACTVAVDKHVTGIYVVFLCMLTQKFYRQASFDQGAVATCVFADRVAQDKDVKACGKKLQRNRLSLARRKEGIAATRANNDRTARGDIELGALIMQICGQGAFGILGEGSECKMLHIGRSFP